MVAGVCANFFKEAKIVENTDKNLVQNHKTQSVYQQSNVYFLHSILMYIQHIGIHVDMKAIKQSINGFDTLLYLETHMH